MKSLKAPSRSIGQNNNPIKYETILSAVSNKNIGMALNSLDSFFSGVFSSIGLEVNKKYMMSDIIAILNDKNIKIVSVCGIECPDDIIAQVIDMIKESESRRKMFGNMFFPDVKDRENFYEIIKHFGEEYTVTSCKVLPTFTQMNQNIHVRDTYRILITGVKEDDPDKTYSVIGVEIS